MKTIKVLIINKCLFSKLNNEYDLYVRNNEKFHVIKHSINEVFSLKKKYDYVILETNDISKINEFYKLKSKLKGNPLPIIISNDNNVKQFAFANNYNFIDLNKFNESDIENNQLTKYGIENFNSNLCLNYVKGEFYHGI